MLIRQGKANLADRKFGGRDRARTGDPLLAKQVLSQLSYTPTPGTLIDSKALATVRKLLEHLRVALTKHLGITACGSAFTPPDGTRGIAFNRKDDGGTSRT